MDIKILKEDDNYVYYQGKLIDLNNCKHFKIGDKNKLIDDRIKELLSTGCLRGEDALSVIECGAVNYFTINLHNSHVKYIDLYIEEDRYMSGIVAFDKEFFTKDLIENHIKFSLRPILIEDYIVSRLITIDYLLKD